MINANWNKSKKNIVVEMKGSKEALINEFRSILDGLVKYDVLDIDITLTILSMVIKDNNMTNKIVEQMLNELFDIK